MALRDTTCRVNGPVCIPYGSRWGGHSAFTGYERVAGGEPARDYYLGVCRFCGDPIRSAYHTGWEWASYLLIEEEP